MRKTSIEDPLYQRIAVDLASQISSGKYELGERIRGRSTLASKYQVSPETIRKAVCILQDVGIVSVQQGVGVEVISIEKAREFMEKYHEISSLCEIKHEITALLDQQHQQQKVLKAKVQDLLDSTERVGDLNPFHPFEVPITEQTNHLGKTVGEINFWQNTMATIIGIQRAEKLILSPGPYVSLKAGDILYIVATEESFHRTKLFLKK